MPKFIEHNKPLVSCVIPSYNHGPYISECIKGLIQQTYENIELLIIDDGSTDDSKDIISTLLKECSTRFSRFEVIYQKNKGLPITLNRALAWSDGQYFSAIASDDIAMANKVSCLLPNFNNDKIAVVSGGYLEIDEKGMQSRTFIPAIGDWKFEDVLSRTAQIYAPTAIFKTSIIKSIGGFWTDIPSEDRAMWLRLTKKGYDIRTTDHVVAYYRRHPNNLSKNTLQMIEGRLKIYDRFEPHPLIPKVRSRDLFGAAREIAPTDRQAAVRYFFNGFRSHPISLFSEAAMRALKAFLIK